MTLILMLTARDQLEDKIKGLQEGADDYLTKPFGTISETIKMNTPAGGRVEISLEKTGENVFLIVHDTGVGIPGDSLPYIFDRFYQVDKSRSQRSQGSGLGLSIVKKIADIHTAVVDVQSEVNKGTAVRVRFMIDTY